MSSIIDVSAFHCVADTSFLHSQGHTPSKKRQENEVG